MSEVAIVGIGRHPWGKWPDKTFLEMAIDVSQKAMKDAGVTWKDIELLVAGETRMHGSSGFLVGSNLAKQLGWTGIPVYNVYNACATGGVSLRTAHAFIAAGLYDMVLCVGADISPKGFFAPKESDVSDATDLDSQRFRLLGLTNPSGFALSARRRMAVYGTTSLDLARVKAKNSRHGSLNPDARYRREYTVEEVLNSPMVASPLTLYELAATSDGAAAVVVCSMKRAKQLTTKPIIIAGISSTSPEYPDVNAAWFASDSAYSVPPPEHTQDEATSKKAYEMAGLGPEDLSLAEVYDLSPNLELDYYEGIGLCKRGEAEKILNEGVTSLGGRVPVNPSGGVSSFGEAIPAQALCQIYENVLQLRGQAGARQVENAKVALSINRGLAGNASCTILKK